MTTANAPKQPATPYDAEIGGMEAMVQKRQATKSWPLLAQKLTLQEGYRHALADLAPLHRQLVEALSAIVRANEAGTFLPDSDHRWQVGRAALDAARKAGL